MVFNPGGGRAASPGSPAEIYLCRPEILHHIPHAGYCDIKEGLIPSILRAGGTIHPVVLDRDVGNFHNRTGYLGALDALFTGSAGWHICAAVRTISRGAVSRRSIIHPTARICGRSHRRSWPCGGRRCGWSCLIGPNGGCGERGRPQCFMGRRASGCSL
jgi:hypothetical protein